LLSTRGGQRRFALQLKQEVLVRTLEIFNVAMIEIPKPGCYFVDYVVVVRDQQDGALELLQ
jgi:hypothetical protein